MKPRILFLTNEQNGAPEEDALLVDFLAKDFDLIVTHPVNCLPLLRTVDGIIIRNIWPTHEYQEDWDDVKAYIRDSDIPVYNPLMFKGDIEGKDYLVVLSEKSYPVIPSVDQVEYLENLPPSSSYWIKPKKSCDGVGAERLTRQELLERKPRGYIIQPFLEFQYEPSFFYVDNTFRHAIATRHRLLNGQTFGYGTCDEDLHFASQFVQWDNLPYGVQRIDAIRTKDGRLLLTEIENLCPYLYLDELDDCVRKDFLSGMRESMLKCFS
jgi:hypothetical protein